MIIAYLSNSCFREEEIIRKANIVDVPFNWELSGRIFSSFTFSLNERLSNQLEEKTYTKSKPKSNTSSFSFLDTPTLLLILFSEPLYLLCGNYDITQHLK